MCSLFLPVDVCVCSLIVKIDFVLAKIVANILSTLGTRIWSYSKFSVINGGECACYMNKIREVFMHYFLVLTLTQICVFSKIEYQQ